MEAGCPSSNTFSEYKDTILGLVGKDYSDIFTDDFVQKSLETQAADWLLKNGVTDQVEAQKKAILLGYITYNTNVDEQTNIRVFIPQESKKKLGQELVDLPLNERAVKEWIDKVNKSIIRESIIKDGGNVENEQDLKKKQIEAIVTNAELQQDLGGGEEAKQEIKDAVSVAVKGMSFEKALEGQESFFTKEEQEKIKQSLDGKKLQVMSVSRLTDPAFFAKEIVSFLEQNAKKDLSDPTRVQAIEIWSKHDGLPIKSILDACKKYRVAPMVSFSITGLGGTSLEGGVMKYKDMLQKVGELIKNGTLNPTTTTVRIDPILVGVTSMDDIKDIVKTAKSFGIKKFVTSLVQSYGYTEGTPKDRKVISGINNALAEEGKTYDWDKFYGRDRNGKINFKPKKEYVDEVSNVLLELDKDPEITIQTCAFGIKGLKVSACLDPMIIERIVGTNVINPDGTYDRDTSRPECMCYGCHSDFFKGQNKKCYSSCAYCYAAHSGDNKLNYYNEDGTLKDNDFTRTEQSQQPVAKNATTQFNVSTAEFYSGAAEGSDTEWGNQARSLGIKVIDYKIENFDKLSDDWKAKIEEEYLQSRAFLGKRPIKGDTYGGKLTRRDMMQADKADAIFAIAERIVNPGGIEYSGGKEYTNNTDHDNVQGGTANAVARGILRGIPIYVFDQSDNQWKIWDKNTKKFVKIEEPTLTPKAAVIGTRQLQDNGKEAIKSILQRTINGQKKSNIQQQKQQQEIKNDDLNIISADKIKSTHILSNYNGASDGLFDNKGNVSIKDIFSNPETEAVIVFTQDRTEKNLSVKMLQYENNQRDKDNTIILRINPSDDEIKKIIKAHNGIGVICGKGVPHRKIDNLYQNVKLEYTEQSQFNGNKFFDNYIMLAYERKIDYLYSQNKNADWTREQIMEKVLNDLRKEYNEMSEEERNDTDKGHYIGELINNFQYVSTLVTVNEEIDDFELEEYDDDNTNDPLWSEQHSTSNMPKEGILKGLLSSFETGKYDWLGTPIMYEPMVINNMLCNVISGSKDSNDMIERMKEASRWNPVFTKIVANLENAGNKRLRSILFTQYANLYKSNYLTVNGNRTIDEGTDFATTSINIGYVSDETKKRFENMESILNDPSGINSFIQDLQTVHSIDDIERSSDELELHEAYGWTDEDAWREYYLPQATDIQGSGYDLDNNKLRSFLGFIGLETNPDEHDLSKLTNQEMAELKANLGRLYMFRAKSDIDDVRELKKEYKSVYQPIINILNKIANQKTESILRTKNQSVFVYADKNYIDTLTDGLHSENKDDFIYEQFLQYELFTSKDGDDRKKLAQGLYSPLLRELALSKNADWFKVQSFFVNKDKKDVKKYSELSPEELHDINHTVFYKEEIANRNRRQQGEKEYVYIHAPIYADSGSLHYYRVPKINLWANNDFAGQYQEPQILTEVKNLIMLETERIKTAKERWKLIENKQLEPIDTYDIMRGKPGKAHKYCFNPMLNEYGEIEENGEKKKVSLYDLIYAPGVTTEQRNQIIHEAACDIIKNVLFQDAKIDKIKTKSNKEVDLRDRMIEHLKKSNFEGWNKALSYFEEKTHEKSKDGTWDGKSYIEGETDYSKIEYALNSYIGQADILQLTISDPALYKDDVDLQKRYKQVQAGYKRPDTKSEYGREWMRTLFIKDNNISLTDEELENMKAFLEQARKTAELNINVNDIVDAFKKINVADAQCYRTLSSYRSVRDMFGQWSSKDEDLYQKIQNGETLTADDYTQVWQTLKPFVYTQQDVEWIDGSGTKRHNKVGYQYKNSENVLFNMYMLFSNNKKQKSKLAELNRFMEAYNIDTAQFESAVKVGREGLIDLNDIAADDVFKYLEEKTGVTKTQDQKCKSGLSGNPHVIHEIPYKEYGIKTSTPPHMFDTEQQLGSQLKKLLQGDIPDSPDTKIYLDTEGLLSVVDNATKDENGKITFKVYGEEITLNEETDKEGRVKRYLKKEDFLKLYNSLMSDMILDEYGDIQDIFKDKNKLSDALQELMKGSPKYDFDIKQALTIDKDGKWTVDPRIPGIKDKVTVLLTSLLKNRINKQLTRGGTAIQMACFDGNVMHDDGEYGPLRIVRNPDGSIDHMECLMPAYSKQFIESMINKDGILDVKKCKDKNLLKALCYRVPTEDIYSMIPLKIVGFTPMQFGTNIMLPREITTLTGSDFDVDKMYMFFPEFRYTNKLIEKNIKPTKTDKQKILHRVITARQNGDTRDFKDILKSEWEKYTFELKINAYVNARQNKYADETLQDSWEREKQKLLREKYWEEFKTRRNIFSAKGNVRAKYSEYDFAKQDAAEQLNQEIKRRKELNENPLTEEETKEFKKNIINNYFNDWIDKNGYRKRIEYITFDSTKDIAENDSAQKRNLLLALMRGAISSPHNITKEQNPGGFDYLKDIANKVNDELEIPMNLTEKQYLNFFNLNMTGKRLIGIYANHNVAHALCQGSKLQLKKPIYFNGKEYQSFGNIYDTSRRRISRNIAEFLAASVDNAKDPVLAKLWQNDHTASTTCFLLRLGVPINEIIDCFKQHHEEKNFETFMKYGPSALKGENMNMSSYDVAQYPYFFLEMYADTIQNIETLNLFLKADSTNGAMYDLSDIIDKTIKLNNLRADKNLVGVDSVLPDFDEDESILHKNKKEIVEDLKRQGGILNSYKTAFYLTYCNYKQYFGEIVDTTLLNKTIQFGQQFKFFTADNIKKFMTEYSKYQLRYLDYFKPKVKYNKETGKYDITSTQDIINNTLKSIPEKFDYYKTKYKDNEFIKMLTLSDDGYLMINNIADMRFETVNAVKAGFNELISNDESYQDANDLLHYTLCVNGFGYDPRSFISLIPLKSIAQLKGINSLTRFFEIDNIDRFEDQFILDNDLEQSISFKTYKEAKAKEKDGLIPFKNREKIIILPGYNNEKIGQHRATIYLKKCYEAEDGYSYYKPIKVEEQTIYKEGITNDGDSYNYKKTEKKLSKKAEGIQADIYKILDEDLVSLDTQPDDFDALAESIMKGFNESNADLSVINKDTVLKALKSTKLGRYFNINSDPMTDYEPIQVDFC